MELCKVEAHDDPEAERLLIAMKGVGTDALAHFSRIEWEEKTNSPKVFLWNVDRRIQHLLVKSRIMHEAMMQRSSLASSREQTPELAQSLMLLVHEMTVHSPRFNVFFEFDESECEFSMVLDTQEDVSFFSVNDMTHSGFEV